jgi:hypothetical protein
MAHNCPWSDALDDLARLIDDLLDKAKEKAKEICESDPTPPIDPCAAEWEEAIRACESELAKPNPSRGITGGYTNVMDCARGLVSELCGGNPVSQSP